jgi:hypothetical protein
MIKKKVHLIGRDVYDVLTADLKDMPEPMLDYITNLTFGQLETLIDALRTIKKGRFEYYPGQS